MIVPLVCKICKVFVNSWDVDIAEPTCAFHYLHPQCPHFQESGKGDSTHLTPHATDRVF